MMRRHFARVLESQIYVSDTCETTHIYDKYILKLTDVLFIFLHFRQRCYSIKQVEVVLSRLQFYVLEWLLVE